MRVSIGRSVLVSSLVVAGASLLSPVSARAASTPVTACGQELDVPGDYHLVSDLGPCTGPGVVVTASDVRLTLAGHTLSGVSTAGGCAEPQIGVDVRNPATNVRVAGGTVTGFADGVSLTAGAHASGLRVLDNCGFGIMVAGDGARVDTSLVSGSVDGIALCNAWDALVTSNDVSGNSRYGVLMSCGLGDDNGNQVVQNILRENGLPGGDGGGIGVFSGSDHRIAGNHIIDNFIGVYLLTTAGTTVEGNTAYRNTTDLVDDAVDCGSDTWTSNLFETDLVAGVPDGGPSGGCIH
jgi:parallel beta-helix repeat protein